MINIANIFTSVTNISGSLGMIKLVNIVNNILEVNKYLPQAKSNEIIWNANSKYSKIRSYKHTL